MKRADRGCHVFARENYQSANAKQRKQVVKMVRDRAVDPNSPDGEAFWQKLCKDTGLTTAMLKRLATDKEQKKLSDWYERTKNERNKQGRGRFWKRFESKDKGRRIAEGGAAKKTFESPLRPIEEQVKKWSDRELEQGYEISQQDLVDEFETQLQSAVYELKQKIQLCGHSLGQDEAKMLVENGSAYAKDGKGNSL